MNESSRKSPVRPARVKSKVRWLAVPITLGVFSLLTVGYLSSFTPAKILDGASESQVRTLQSTVDGALRDAGVELRPEDVVEPGLDTPLQRGQTITIKRARLVRVTVDGQEPKLVRTQRINARDLLKDVGYTFGLYDALRVNGEFIEAIPAAPVLPVPTTVPDASVLAVEPIVAEIDVRRALPLTVEEMGAPAQDIKTTAQTVGEALLQAGHILYLADRIDPAPGTLVTPGMKVSIQRAKPVTIWVDGRAVRTRTHAQSVAELLAEMNIILLENDYTRPSLSDPVTPSQEVRVVRVTRDIQIRQDAVAFDTRWEANPELEIDNQALGQEGAPGVREQRDLVTYEDGLEVRRERVADFTARAVQDKIYNYGTKIVVRDLSSSAGPLQYWRKVRMLATSYSASTAGVSRSKAWYGVARCGQTMRRGIVAVDPRVIPLGTSIYVEGYGVGFACDTGSAIIGKRIDLGYGDTDLELWYRWVDVYILTPVPPAPRYRLE